MFLIFGLAATNLTCGPGLNTGLKAAQGLCQTAAGLAGVPYAGGAGTAGNPYVICTGVQLNALGQNSGDFSKYFVLMNDIDLSAYTGSSFNTIGNAGIAFTGNFNGNSHTISNFTYTVPTSNAGLFGATSTPAVITNIKMVNATVSGQYGVGALVGIDNGGTVISNCSTSGTMTASLGEVGGLIGTSNSAVISNCSSQASASAQSNGGAGGLVGYTNGGSITQSYATGSVTNIGVQGGGGLVGNHVTSTITSCFATGSVTDNTSGSSGVAGGLVGAMSSGGTIYDSYSTGSVTMTNSGKAGGLVGSNTTGGGISRCYATGAVSGSGATKGGIVASISGGTYANNYYDQSTTGQSTSADGGSTAESTSSMKTQSTYTGWDFSTMWKMNGGSYPKLQWQ